MSQLGTGMSKAGSYKCGGIPMDSLITVAARALARGDVLGAFNRVDLRDDTPGLALRGIALSGRHKRPNHDPGYCASRPRKERHTVLRRGLRVGAQAWLRRSRPPGAAPPPVPPGWPPIAAWRRPNGGRRADRLFDILQILRVAVQPMTAATLAERLEVTVRTVYRDIATLQARRIPIEGAAGIGDVLRRGFDLPPTHVHGR
jgi:hypothetical protein